jgi:hypothetical protein
MIYLLGDEGIPENLIALLVGTNFMHLMQYKSPRYALRKVL